MKSCCINTFNRLIKYNKNIHFHNAVRKSYMKYNVMNVDLGMERNDFKAFRIYE